MDPALQTAIAALGEQYPPALVGELLQATAIELEEKRIHLEQAIGSGDGQATRRAAHSLKATAGAIGLQALGEAAALTEHAQEAELPARANTLLDAVRTCGHALHHHLESLP